MIAHSPSLISGYTTTNSSKLEHADRVTSHITFQSTVNKAVEEPIAHKMFSLPL